MPKSNADLEFRASDNYVAEGLTNIQPLNYYPEPAVRDDAGYGTDYMYGPTYDATTYGMKWSNLN